MTPTSKEPTRGVGEGSDANAHDRLGGAREPISRAAIERVTLVLLEEAIRRDREYRRPVNRASRALGGLWRSIASGGWE